MELKLIRVSNRGVPHQIIEIDGTLYSICWFGKGRFYRIFTWGEADNRRICDIKVENGQNVLAEQIEKAIKENK